jgi:S-formylglutathione hydrolase
MTKSKFIEVEMRSDFVSQPVEYGVLLPPEYDVLSEPIPLCLFLHGGGGSRKDLQGIQALIEECWAEDTLPPMVFATVSAGFSMFMDARDGSERWDSFIQGPFLAQLRDQYRVQNTASGTLLLGLSMGGHGVLRMAFEHPERYHAVAALEPGIDATLEFADILPQTRFWRNQEVLETIYGKPIDTKYWAATHPANILIQQAERIRESGLAILLEAGDQDFLELHHGAEYLHRLLWDHQVPHEYHLVRWADHFGQTLTPRIITALKFLATSLSPPQPEPGLLTYREQYAAFKAQVPR